MLEVGKLYACEEYFLLLYPDKETAATAYDSRVRWPLSYEPAVAIATTAVARSTAAFWSNLGKPVSYVDKNIPLLVLNSKDKCIEVLAGDRKGWIMYQGFLNIKEIDYA